LGKELYGSDVFFKLTLAIPGFIEGFESLRAKIYNLEVER
jgi:hypothetical protein